MQRGILKIVNLQFLPKRFYKKHPVRVRFAPSPTGHLHLGGLRTALYNYLFTRSKDGSFIVRVEDTDRTRIEPGAMKSLEEDLFWAGIIPDEDPVRGGPYGPYVQSKRLEIYREQVKKLLDNNTAYACFCTERRLEILKREAVKNSEVPKYDNRCRHLSKEETREKLRKSETHCIRFKLSSEPEPFHDLVYGEIGSTAAQNEGDPVIIKTDGYPTYHFACVVDDHMMNISHVLRGVEWQISTPKHIQIYKAFGWEPPLFAHLPLILNPNGTKLSKRQGDIRVDTYRKQGIFPMALLNFITCAGGGFNREQGKNRCYSYAELIKQEILVSDSEKNSIVFLCSNFASYSPKPGDLYSLRVIQRKPLNGFCSMTSHFLRNNMLFGVNAGILDKFELSRINTNSSRLAPEKLLEFNKLELCQLLENEDNHKFLINRVRRLVQEAFPDRSLDGGLQLDDEHVISTLKWAKDRISRMDDLVSNDLSFLWIVPTISPINEDQQYLDTVKIVCEKLNEVSTFEKATLTNLLRDTAKNNDIHFSKFMKILRAILSGLEEGPGVAEMMQILGREKTIVRLKRALS